MVKGSCGTTLTPAFRLGGEQHANRRAYARIHIFTRSFATPAGTNHGNRTCRIYSHGIHPFATTLNLVDKRGPFQRFAF
jgi:hypothetical protein